jgi:4-hydroxy-tetrahydrodipicolinate reductase
MNYGLVGAYGKMGREIENVFREAGNELVFKYDKSGTEFTATPEVLVDFSLPDAFDATVEFTNKYKVPLVIGTTGLSENQIKILQEISQTVPIVQSYNFSIGIQMLLKCVEILNENLPGWDIEISETHHRFKKDKPSGTAMMIKNALNKEVNITSLRLGNIPGDHSVYFGGLGEVLSVSHHATSRRTFAEGVLKSAQFILSKQNGFFSFKDVLFSKG